jgi:endonuclease III
VISKTKKIESLAKILQKRHKNLPNPQERTVLAHLIYAALLENTSFEQADSAFTVLENYFIDWNEIRVSTVNELADTFPILSDPLAAGERVRRTLQGVFEKTYMFDLEELRKKGKNIKQAVEFLNSIPGCTHFMIDYTTQVAFGGHVIPLDEASLRVFRLLDLTHVNKEGTRENVTSLDRTIQKKNGLTFSLQLHHFAASFYNDPELTELRSILKSIDPEAENRSWTPPVLTVPKPVAKPSVKLPPPPLAAIPSFGVSDDDDFDEEHGGTEAEFIPDEMIYQHDSSILSEQTNTKVVTSSTKKKKTPKQEKKTSVKKNTDSVSDLPNSSQTIPQTQEKQPEPTQEKTKKVAKNEANKKTTSKNNKTIAKSDTKTITETNDQSNVIPDTKPDVKSDTKTITETKNQSDVIPDTKPDVKSDTKTITETKDQSKVIPDMKPDVKSDTKTITEIKDQSDVIPDTKPVVKSDTKTITETKDQSGVIPDTKPVVKSDTKTITETNNQSNIKPETKPVVKPDTEEEKHTTKSGTKTKISKISHTTSSSSLSKQVVNNSEELTSPPKKKNTEKINEEKQDTKTVKSTIKQLVKKKPK